MGVYTIVIESDVHSSEEANSALDLASKLAAELDVAWCYAWGRPFACAVMTARSYEAPDGWSGNFQAVAGAIERELRRGYSVATQVIGYNWVWLPSLPLKKVLEVRRLTIAAPEVIKELIELHIRSLKDPSDGRLFLLAKSLEIVGAFFNGSRTIRNEGIQSEMDRLGLSHRLMQSTEWLFNIMNTRFDVRHASDHTSPGVKLHPRISREECKAFEHDSDLIIRAFIGARLGYDEVNTRTIGDPKTRPKWTDDDRLSFDDG